MGCSTPVQFLTSHPLSIALTGGVSVAALIIYYNGVSAVTTSAIGGVVAGLAVFAGLVVLDCEACKDVSQYGGLGLTACIVGDVAGVVGDTAARLVAGTVDAIIPGGIGKKSVDYFEKEGGGNIVLGFLKGGTPVGMLVGELVSFQETGSVRWPPW